MKRIFILLVICFPLICSAITKRELLKIKTLSEKETIAKSISARKRANEMDKPKFILLEIEDCLGAIDCQSKLEKKVCLQGIAIKNLEMLKVYCAFNVH